MRNESEVQRDVLKKHAALIHCSNKLSLLQRKISNCLLLHAYEELMIAQEHLITVKQLCNMIGYNGNNQKVIKDAMRGLISTVIEWNVIDNLSCEEDWTASTVLSSVRIKGSACTYSYSPRMKELLYSPSNYAKINLLIQSKFKSSYGLALYENCMRYEKLSYTRWIDIETFRKLMGIPDSEYIIFRDLKRRVIDKSIEEVNQYSHLNVTPEYIKHVRKIAQIRFKITSKPAANDSKKYEACNNERGRAVINALVKNFGFSLPMADRLLSTYGENLINKKIEAIKLQKINWNTIQNKAGYFTKMLSVADSGESNPVDFDKDYYEKRDFEEHKKTMINKYSTEYHKYQMENLFLLYTDMTANERELIETMFSKIMARHKFSSCYEESGLAHPLVKIEFCLFLRKQFPSWLEGLMSIENFIKHKEEMAG
jgi:plasmid replication initiation protein